MKYVGKGVVVTISIPPEDMLNNPVAKFNGQEFEVVKCVQPRKTMKPYYELDGAESEYGTPYGFLWEWLTPME